MPNRSLDNGAKAPATGAETGNVRRLALLYTAAAALALASMALGANGAPRVVVMKDASGVATRAFAGSGAADETDTRPECTDPAYAAVGARWPDAESSYMVNLAPSRPT